MSPWMLGTLKGLSGAVTAKLEDRTAGVGLWSQHPALEPGSGWLV